LMSQHLYDVVANVRDFRAPQYPIGDDTALLQYAIDKADGIDHVIFPRGPWDPVRRA